MLAPLEVADAIRTLLLTGWKCGFHYAEKELAEKSEAYFLPSFPPKSAGTWMPLILSAMWPGVKSRSLAASGSKLPARKIILPNTKARRARLLMRSSPNTLTRESPRLTTSAICKCRRLTSSARHTKSSTTSSAAAKNTSRQLKKFKRPYTQAKS